MSVKVKKNSVRGKFMFAIRNASAQLATLDAAGFFVHASEKHSTAYPAKTNSIIPSALIRRPPLDSSTATGPGSVRNVRRQIGAREKALDRGHRLFGTLNRNPSVRRRSAMNAKIRQHLRQPGERSHQRESEKELEIGNLA
jgi:hypothetical protein